LEYRIKHFPSSNALQPRDGAGFFLQWKNFAAVNFLAGTISTPTERNKLGLKENLFRPQTVFLSIVVVLIVLSAKI
jgi:hypothetical protein